MNVPNIKRCAIYTRKSTEEGLDQEFNSLHAQREACEAYILSQKHEGWELLPSEYDDGGFSGGNIKRPALQKLMQDIESGKVDIIVVYKVDRLTRSLADFAKLVELMDSKGVSFVSVTQQFNTTTSMGRLTLNVLLSFAQFEREVTGERIRDKIAASKKKGMWMGGMVPLGYRVEERKLLIDEVEANKIRYIYQRYLELGSVNRLKSSLDSEECRTRRYENKAGTMKGGKLFTKGNLYNILQNPVYIGKIVHKEQSYDGEHDAIIDDRTFEKVQKLINANRYNHSNAVSAKSPSMLAGLLFDDKGNPMSPKHSRTRKRYYRYYTSQAIIQSRHHEAGSLPNVPAGEIEKLIKQEIQSFLHNTERLQSEFSQFSVDQQKSMINAANSIHLDENKHTYCFLRALIKKVELSDRHVQIELCSNTLQHYLQSGEIISPSEESHPISIRRNISLSKVNRGSKVITDRIENCSNMQLVKAISRSYLWHEQLINGEVESIAEIRRREELSDTSYVAKIMRLRFLAPDIIERILSGTQPAHWTIAKLFEVKAIEWASQRQHLGLCWQVDL